MRRRSQRRRFSAMSIWFVVLACAMGITVWKYDWLPVGLGDAESGSLVSELDSDDLLIKGFENSSETINVDPIVFDAQSEPPVGVGRNVRPGNFAGRRPRTKSKATTGSRIAKTWDDPVVPSLPARFPNVANSASSIEQPRGVEPRFRQRSAPGTIIQVGNEVEQQSPSRNTTANRVQNNFVGARQVERTATSTSNSQSTTPVDLVPIDLLIEQGDIVTAHRELSKIYWNNPEQRSLIQKRIDKTAGSIYFSPQPHYMDPYVIEPGDQMRKVAKQYHVPWEYLAKLNQIDPRKIRAGQKLKVIKGPFAAVVDLSDYVLTVHAHGYYVRRYLVGIGKDGRTPLGRFVVLNKVANPQYTDPEGRVMSGDDPDNPLGERWLDIGDGFGIHGTIDPTSIGKNESRGCIRMHNSDVAEVYDLLDFDSEIIIRK